MIRKTLVVPVLIGLLAPALAACGGDDGSGGGGDAIRVGTTDTLAASKDNPAPVDPATAYDINSWNILQNTFQLLMRVPRTGNEPQPDAAKDCRFTDRHNESYRCDLRPGLKFSNGHALTAQDVEFSIKRMLRIHDDNGPYTLLTNIDTVEAKDDTTVVFHLKTADATFPYKLATPAAAIVDQEVYPAKGLHKGLDIVGSGPYTVKFEAADGNVSKAVYSKNSNYEGPLKIGNDKVEVQIFTSSVKMEKALTDGKIDLTNRLFTPAQVQRLESKPKEGIKLTENNGAEIRYLAFNTNDPSVRSKAVRRAIAQVVDREAIARNVYKRTADPLYSMVPQGFGGHNTAFYDVYGEPSAEKARTILKNGGVTTPVRLTLNYTTDHYGAVTKDEFKELQKQLNATGLFQATIKGTTWDKFKNAYNGGKYGIFGMGWFPDFPDPDNYLAPFIGKDNFLHSPYRNPAIEALIPLTRQQAERARTNKDFEKAQDLIAEDAPIIPLWQGKQYVTSRDTITGSEWALNSSSTLQLWELHRGLGE
ncbi:MAG: ABC transporter substrate-binding protein [Streptomyces sp.]|jgi:peptide/nickel transport system substrate-binding protein|nr:ABC transporter substrate-binding protein [Streptomyces sp.]